jgi:hypothetical protein
MRACGLYAGARHVEQGVLSVLHVLGVALTQTFSWSVPDLLDVDNDLLLRKYYCSHPLLLRDMCDLHNFMLQENLSRRVIILKPF